MCDVKTFREVSLSGGRQALGRGGGKERRLKVRQSTKIFVIIAMLGSRVEGEGAQLLTTHFIAKKNLAVARCPSKIR